MAKAKYFYKSEGDESEKSLFVASNSWVNNFMYCKGFWLQCKITTAQQYPERLIGKLIPYVLHAHKFSIKYKYPPSSIIAMEEEETSISYGTVSYTAVHKQEVKSV